MICIQKIWLFLDFRNISFKFIQISFHLTNEIGKFFAQ